MKKLCCMLAALLLTGCSSIINGSSQEILFTGNEKDIKIKKEGVFLCQTPCVASIKRNGDGIVLMAEKEGYDTTTIMLRSKLSYYFWGNMMTSGALGTFSSSTDATSGGMWEYAPDQYYVHLTKDGKTNQKDLEIKLFVMKNFTHLKKEINLRYAFSRTIKGEYLQALSELTGADEQVLIAKIASCKEAAFCAEVLTGL